MRTHLLAATGASCAIVLALAGGGVSAAGSTVAGQGDGCSPNYSGCVRIPSDGDVNCDEVDGPVTVLNGNDIYGLDGDDDGVGCDGGGDGGGGGGGGGGNGNGNGNGGGAGGGADAGGSDDTDGEGLAETGTSSGALVGGAGLALVAGSLALLASRRRAA